MTTRQTVTIQGPVERDQIARWARNVEAGTVVTFRKKSRSTEQSAKMWAMLSEVAEQVEWYGQKLDAEDWKDMFTASLRHARVVPGIDKGTYVPLGMHTSTLTVEEMSNLIELIYAFGAEHGVVFKDPKEPDQPDSGDVPPPDEADDASPIPSSAEEVGDPPLTSSTISDADLDWLKTVTKMLWSATHAGKENLHILETQKMCVPSGKPFSEDAREKARKIYEQLEKVPALGHDKAGKRGIVANIAGINPRDLEA
ncbi:hypothetical protein J2X76_003631 [Neorhizobium sp. 2083]|uniref:recombination protein NinB n=1 Tax=Neorhizobium sp. 2083 TaxID=2817762 RepID=UPI002864E575|nr:recombination protein NinB [Neorhizobium sp. 2083]MDR6818454.1 hypothetical protein [Neorhizobium sp. 2083]